MKTKKSNILVVILFAVIFVILAGAFLAWMTGMFKNKKKELNAGADKINDSVSSIADFDVDIYNGASINGVSLVELIEEVIYKGRDISIAVQTLANLDRLVPITIYYNRALAADNEIDSGGVVTTLHQNISSNNYITPSANFVGKVLRNTNNEVTGILFVQKK